jgi:hypothetical protein
MELIEGSDPLRFIYLPIGWKNMLVKVNLAAFLVYMSQLIDPNVFETLIWYDVIDILQYIIL